MDKWTNAKINERLKQADPTMPREVRNAYAARLFDLRQQALMMLEAGTPRFMLEPIAEMAYAVCEEYCPTGDK